MLRTLLVLATLGLIVRLWQLQVVRGPAFYSAALNESLHVVTIPAPRGQILDRHGLVLATDVPVFDAALAWTKTPPAPAEVALLSGILGMSPRAVDAVAAQVRQASPLTPQTLKDAITPGEYTLLVEHRAELPGVEILTQPVRRYPGIPGDANPGPELAANVLGYVQDGKLPGDVTGADGVEKSYNGPVPVPGGGTVLGLQGLDGKDYMILDQNGHPVGQVGLSAPIPGDSVVLTIDAKLQAVAQHALSAQMAALRTRSFSGDGGPFPQAYAGAAVVIDVRNGQVLALASEPSFNPNAFAAAVNAPSGSAAQRAFAAQYQRWLSQPGSPLIDHAISDVAPPGSTFKPITAIAALEQGVITPRQHLPCPASIQLAPGYVLHNWIPVFGGNLDLTEAIARSCDTYFYAVGARTGIAAIDRVARAFGLGQLTGQTALYGEDPGQVSSPALQPAALGPWTTALTMQSAIGQGLSAFNPLEMADYVAALANGGTLWRPYFVSEVRSPSGRVLVRTRPQVRARIPLSPTIVQAIHQAMTAVTQVNPAWLADGIDSDFGTAYWTYYGFSSETAQVLGRTIQVAGKTGTAQTVPGATSDGWWISWAPANHPQIAVVVFIHHAGEGFGSGGPVAREIYDYYFGLDRAMWQAGKAQQIIPPVISTYFGMSPQVPDWWPSTPPPAKALSRPAPTTTPGTYGRAQSGLAHASTGASGG